MRFRGPSTRVIERPDAFATPGLIDAHGHMESLGASQEELDLRGVASLEEVARRVKARIEATPGDSWITGRNWDQSLWPGGAFPTAAVLDAVSPHRPVWLERVDGHAGWANSEAMRRAKVTKDAKAPSDGQIIRDSDGQPTGVFIDGAMSLVGRAVPGPTLERRQAPAARGPEAGAAKRPDRRPRRRHLAAGRRGLSRARSRGQARGSDLRDGLAARRRRGRVREPAAAESSPPGRGSSCGPSSSSSTARWAREAAFLFEPYQRRSGQLRAAPDRSQGARGDRRRPRSSNGWQVCTHAIGDKGNALVLDAYAAARKAVPEARDPRLRIEHAQVVRKEDVRRFARARA